MLAPWNAVETSQICICINNSGVVAFCTVVAPIGVAAAPNRRIMQKLKMGGILGDVLRCEDAMPQRLPVSSQPITLLAFHQHSAKR